MEGNRRNNRSTRLNAFTLVEVLVVVVIIGILASLLFPALSTAQSYAHSTSCKSHLRQMGHALKMYVDENRSTYPNYLGPAGPSYGDDVGKGGRATGLIYWSTKLYPYYPINWTNKAYHCPGYKGIAAGPGYFKGAIDRLGSYAYNVDGAKVLENTYAKTHEHFGLGPVIYWSEAPAVSEGTLALPSEMLSIGESRFNPARSGGIPGGQDIMRCGLLFYPVYPEVDFDANRHGKKYNQLFCDGHVAALSPWMLFNPTNTAPMWNYDHQPHPEIWIP